MKIARLFVAVVAAIAFTSSANAQEFPKPGPEHEVLKKMEGDWTLTMKAEGMESKGTVTYKMDLGGLWLIGNLECEFAPGMKFSGRGMDTYDAAKKVYRSIWIDNMSATPMLMEGTYDKDKKTLTMTGDGPTPDGKTAKWKSTMVMADNDTVNFSMYVGDAKDPMFTIVYKRKK